MEKLSAAGKEVEILGFEAGGSNIETMDAPSMLPLRWNVNHRQCDGVVVAAARRCLKTHPKERGRCLALLALRAACGWLSRFTRFEPAADGKHACM